MSRAQASRIIGHHKDGLPIEEICRLNRMTLADIRREPATPKQRWLLQKLGIPVADSVSKRQASALIEERLKNGQCRPRAC